jgi:hypothetical protein
MITVSATPPRFPKVRVETLVATASDYLIGPLQARFKPAGWTAP